MTGNFKGALLTTIFASGVVWCGSATAVPAQGTLAATGSCDLYTSFRKANNPDGLKTEPGTAYVVREINVAGDYQWLRVEVPGATPTLRWVARSCGTPTLADAGTSGGSAGPAGDAPHSKSLPGRTGAVAGRADAAAGSRSAGGSCSTPNLQDSYVLALTWQPGFCEHFSYNGRKPECDALNAGRIKISNLTLHGLWPNRKSCGTNYGNCDGAPLQLSKATIDEIAPWMPNFYFEETFGRYEWNKHGTCQQLPADEYFRTAVQAVKVVNDSVAGQMIVGNSGGRLRVKDFFARLQQEHGSGVAAAFTLVCSQQKYLQEIRVELPLHFRLDQGLPGLVQSQSGRIGRTSGCLVPELLIEDPGR